MQVSISKDIKQHVPTFKVGVITYHDIVVSETPQLLKGRLDYFREELMLSLEEKSVGELVGVKEWRKVFKAIGTDPSRYRPSHEALLRRLQKGQPFPVIHSAADINNYFSAHFELPIGIYDLKNIQSPVTIKIGTEQDNYEGLNGRQMAMNQKLISCDEKGAFGSPIVDSKRTMTTHDTKNALQIVYMHPSDQLEHCKTILKSISDLFTQINGGEANISIID